MEIFELKYFLAVAGGENIHRASEKLHVSPGSLSKAIARLEDELGIKLFSREGRNIRLTASGKILEQRASEIVQLEESSKLEILGAKGSLHAVIAGAEVLLSHAGMAVAENIKKKFPAARIEFHHRDEDETVEEVLRGEAHLGIVTRDPPSRLRFKALDEAVFVTCVGAGHPLYALARAKKSIPVEEVLTHSFVSPSHPLLGQVSAHQSFDGWRDDKFPRRVEYLTSSLRLLEELVSRGRAIAYLPDYLAVKLDAQVLNVSGCPYRCKQRIRLIARQTKGLGWLNRLF